MIEGTLGVEDEVVEDDRSLLAGCTLGPRSTRLQSALCSSSVEGRKLQTTIEASTIAKASPSSVAIAVRSSVAISM